MKNIFRITGGRLGKALFLAMTLSVISVVVVLAAVSLENFEGSWDTDTDTVNLVFSTGSELDHAGFHVWRSDTNVPPGEVNDTNSVRLTTNVLVGNPCQAVGFDYTYDDDTVDPIAEGYYYYLESVPCSSGDTTFYGSQTVEGSGLEVENPSPTEPTYATYMPLVGTAATE